MKNFILVFVLVSFSVFQSFSQCEMDDEICFSYCSDTWNGAGLMTSCMNPSENSVENPLILYTCYNNSSELVQPHGTVQKIVHLCLTDDLCAASLKQYKIQLDGSGKENDNRLIYEDPRVYVGINRTTFCNDCKDGNRYVTLGEHQRASGEAGSVYKVELTYTCCDENGNEIGTNTINMYYKFEDLVSDYDVDLSFTATNQVEQINGDNDLNGLLINTGTLPGPELGPASAGVKITNGGDGVLSYTVDVFEVSCTDGTILENIHSSNILYNEEDAIIYSFLDIPNWGSVYSSEKCYKVDVEVETVCGSYNDEGYFTITDQCTLCMQDEDNSQESEKFSLEFDVRNDNVEVKGSNELKVGYLIDLNGRLLEVFDEINSSNFEFNNSYSGIGTVLVLFDKYGNSQKISLIK